VESTEDRPEDRDVRLDECEPVDAELTEDDIDIMELRFELHVVEELAEDDIDITEPRFEGRVGLLEGLREGLGELKSENSDPSEAHVDTVDTLKFESRREFRFSGSCQAPLT